MKKVPWHKKFIYLFINSRSKIVYRLDLYNNFIYREYAQIGLDNNIINCLHCIDDDDDAHLEFDFHTPYCLVKN